MQTKYTESFKIEVIKKYLNSSRTETYDDVAEPLALNISIIGCRKANWLLSP